MIFRNRKAPKYFSIIEWINSLYIHRLEFCDQWKEHITNTWIFNSLLFIKKENVQEYNQTGCREAHMMKNWESGQQSARNWYLPTTTQKLRSGPFSCLDVTRQWPWLAACLHSQKMLWTRSSLPDSLLTETVKHNFMKCY